MYDKSKHWFFYDHDDEMNYTQDCYISHIKNSTCPCIKWNVDNPKLYVEPSHDTIDISNILHCLNESFSKNLSRNKWLNDKIKNNHNNQCVESLCDCTRYDKVWGSFDNEFALYHETNKHLNVELGEWYASI